MNYHFLNKVIKRHRKQKHFIDHSEWVACYNWEKYKDYNGSMKLPLSLKKKKHSLLMLL
jgi:hypothetical protein